jgi:hypothetical protein
LLGGGGHWPRRGGHWPWVVCGVASSCGAPSLLLVAGGAGSATLEQSVIEGNKLNGVLVRDGGQLRLTDCKLVNNGGYGMQLQVGDVPCHSAIMRCEPSCLTHQGSQGCGAAPLAVGSSHPHHHSAVSMLLFLGCWLLMGNQKGGCLVRLMCLADQPAHRAR